MPPRFSFNTDLTSSVNTSLDIKIDGLVTPCIMCCEASCMEIKIIRLLGLVDYNIAIYSNNFNMPSYTISVLG
jgi:hypothetical protein